ncbi:VapA/VapB family virulence-associated protein [Oerskovia sp. NPDC057915]|uniref:VapA/VapB family virulence-associated protein n=1 Tax=Oerskovia sp. NPDC057915 TaxID=3346280 RepID=UPI0036D772F9
MSETTIDIDTVVGDFRTSVQEALDQERLDAAVETLRTARTEYPATCRVVNGIFFAVLEVSITGGKTFRSTIGGIGIGGGEASGTVFTDDIERLYRSTVSFQFNATPVYFNVNFFDGGPNLVGNGLFGTVLASLGTGGGTGTWS